MKHSTFSRWTTVFLLVAALLLCCQSCKEKDVSATPGEVVKIFISETISGDSESAYEMLCRDNKSLVSATDFKELYNLGEEDTPGIEIAKEDIQGEEAIVTVRFNGSELRYIKLLKEDGEWKLDLEDNIKQLKKSPGEESCGNNLRVIDAALAWYMNTHDEAPKDVQSLLPKYLQDIPQCPGGGSYSIIEGKNGDLPHAVCSAGHTY